MWASGMTPKFQAPAALSVDKLDGAGGGARQRPERQRDPFYSCWDVQEVAQERVVVCRESCVTPECCAKGRVAIASHHVWEDHWILASINRVWQVVRRWPGSPGNLATAAGSTFWHSRPHGTIPSQHLGVPHGAYRKLKVWGCFRPRALWRLPRAPCCPSTCA